MRKCQTATSAVRSSGSADGASDSTADRFLALFDGPAKAIKRADAIRGAARAHGLDVSIGIHTGEVEKRSGDDVAGIGVHIGARVAAKAGSGEILVSSVIPSLVVGSDIEFAERGAETLNGVPEGWRLYAVTSA